MLVWIFIGFTFNLGDFENVFWLFLALGIIANITSLVASWYIYDFSNLYSLKWLSERDKKLQLEQSNKLILNIHAGFDETSSILRNYYPEASIQVMDFYDPNQHTEVSIERARRAYRHFPDTIPIVSNKIPLDSNSADKIFLLLAAHEIRNQEERETFFKECKRILRAQGSIIVLEHLRDFPNFLVYTIGFFHFHSHRTWLNTFHTAGLTLRAEKKVTPFLSYFELEAI